MECKVCNIIKTLHFLYIGIYPEWNVKERLKTVVKDVNKIGIYPEWNVKLYNRL